jgi:hypothetical protein
MQEWEQVNAAFPRQDFKNNIIGHHIELCRLKPNSTYGTYQADFGENYLKEEGYSEVGYRNIDLLESVQD